MSSAGSGSVWWGLTTYSGAGGSPQPRSKPAPRQETPVFSECVIGYRTWIIDPFLRLWPMSSYGDQPWVPGVNEATCGRDHVPNYLPQLLSSPAPVGHAAPHARCDCGLYSRRRLKQTYEELKYPQFAKLRYAVVAGAVAVWGDLRVHRDGFRASHAAVVALAETPNMVAEMRDLARRVAAEYKVPLVAIDQLEAEASRHGSPLPDDVGPQAPADTDLVWPPGMTPGGSWRSIAGPPEPPARMPSVRSAVAAGFGVVGASLAWNFGAMAVLGHHWYVLAVNLVCDAGIGWGGAKLLGRAAGFRAKEQHRDG